MSTKGFVPHHLRFYIRRAVLLLFLLIFGRFAQTVNGQGINAGIDRGRVHVNDLLWDLESLARVPAFSWVKSDSIVASLLYSSVDVNGKPTRVFAYYSDPDRIKGRAVSGKKYPAVVLVHGGGGRAFPEWVAKWANAGYAAIAMDLAGKDGAGHRLEDGGPDQSNENKIMHFNASDPKKSWSYHAVASVILAHSLVRTMPAVEADQTFVTGISWGGYLTCMVAGLDNRFKGAVPVYGCGFLGESDIFKNQLGRLDPATRKVWLDLYDPSVYLSFASMPVMFLNGNKDKHYNVVPYDKTYRLVPEKQRFLCIRPDMRHGHPPGWEPMEIKRFFDQLRKEAKPLPRVSRIEETDSIITFHTTGEIVAAHFYHSNQTDVLNELREWQHVTIPLTHSTRRVTVQKPAPGFRYAFLKITDVDGYSASSEFLIK